MKTIQAHLFVIGPAKLPQKYKFYHRIPKGGLDILRGRIGFINLVLLKGWEKYHSIEELRTIHIITLCNEVGPQITLDYDHPFGNHHVSDCIHCEAYAISRI